MPSKNNSEKLKRPPSPYSASCSPRAPPNKTKMWRPLTTGGNKHQEHVLGETTREMWLRSLRLGTVEAKSYSRDETYKRKSVEELWVSTFRSNSSNMRQSPVKAVHGMNGTNGNVNLALASSSEYLREQLGITAGSRGHKRSGSVGSRTPGSRPGTPRYKSQEEMYEEIIQLKKTITSQKTEYDTLKSRVRRIEEESQRKDKSLDQLLEHVETIESGKSKPGGDKVVTATMKQRQLRTEKKLQEREDELLVAKERIKTLRSKAKAAKSSYLEEVMRLQDALKTENAENMESDEEGMTKSEKMSKLRESVVKLTSENTRLQKDNHCLRRDLERAIDGEEEEGAEEEEEEIKYSALNRMELLSVVKKLKSEEKSKLDDERAQHKEEQARLKKIIRQHKDEKVELRNKNSKQLLKIEKLEESIERMTEETKDLSRQLRIKSDTENRQEIQRKRSETRQKEAAEEIERKHVEIKRNNAASTIQRQWKKHRKDKVDDETVSFIQSSFRGHLAREDLVRRDARSSRPTSGRRASRSTSPRSVSSLGALEELDDSPDSGDESGINYIQAAMRGHIAREEYISSDKQPTRPSSRASAAGSAASGRRWSSQKSHDYMHD